MKVLLFLLLLSSLLGLSLGGDVCPSGVCDSHSTIKIATKQSVVYRSSSYLATYYSYYYCSRWYRSSGCTQTRYRQDSHLYTTYYKLYTSEDVCCEGYQKLGSECKDINECIRDQPCAYRCVNTCGGYYCVCSPGYTVASDGHGCEAPPSGSPHNSTIIKVKPSLWLIWWSPPLTPNGIITSYTLYVNYANGTDAVISVDGDVTRYLLTGFFPDQYVTVEISASTLGGEGPSTLVKTLLHLTTGPFDKKLVVNIWSDPSPNGTKFMAATPVTLTCGVTGNATGPLQLLWTSTCTGECFTANKMEAVITRDALRSIDSGVHTCMIVSEDGKLLGSATLEMLVSGTGLYSNLTGPLQSNDFIVVDWRGQIGELICSSGSSNGNTARWIAPSGEDITANTSDSFYVTVGGDDNPGFLSVSSSNLSYSDQGVYSCSIQDETGDMQFLHVGIYLSTPGLPTLQTCSFRLLTNVFVNPPVFNITCGTYRYPPASVEWRADISNSQVWYELLDVNSGDKYQFIQVLRDGATATYDNILTVTGRYPGEYEFAVTNRNGLRETTRLHVAAPESTVRSVQLAQTNLTTVKVTWQHYYNNSEHNTVGFKIHYQSESEEGIINAGYVCRDYGSYYSYAERCEYLLPDLNSTFTYNISVVGFSTHLPGQPSLPATVTLVEIPKLPSELELSSRTPTSVYISWSDPANDTVIDHFEVSYRYLGTCYLPRYEARAGTLEIPVNTTDREYTVERIEEFSEYEIIFSAINAAGRNDSSPLTITTLPGAPTGIPHLYLVEIVSATSARLYWESLSCDQINGPELEYMIQYTSSYSVENVTVTVAGDLDSYRLTGLKPYTDYYFRCAAVNSIGNGPLSSIEHGTTYESVPGPVGSLQVILSSSSVELRWTQPPEPNGIIRQYQVWKEDEQGNDVYKTLYSAYQLNYHFYSLYPSTNYTFAVRAYTYQGYGNWTYMEITTPPVPQMEGVVVYIIDATSVRVSWVHPSVRDIYRYTVYYCPVSGTSKRHQQRDYVQFPSYYSSAEISGLLPNADYQFQVSVTLRVEGRYFEGPLSAVTENSTSGIREALFQLRFGPVDHCSSWTVSKASNIEQQIGQMLVTHLNEQCSCSLDTSHIKKGVFSCLHTITTDHVEVVYRSTIIGSERANAYDLIDLLGEWVNSNPVVVLDDTFILRLNPSCPVEITSLQDPECLATEVPLCECAQRPGYP